MFSTQFGPIRKFVFFGFLTGILIFLAVFLNREKTESDASRPCRVITITQIAPHPSLDEIRRGIMDELTPEKLSEQHIKPVDILFENAQGNLATATQIATKFVSLNPAVMIPITTPSAQSLYNVAKGRDLPIVFAAVSDPETAKLLPTKESPYITGVSDLAPVKAQAQLIIDILPDAPLKTIGIIFNPGEANSVRLVELMTQALGVHHLKVIHATASNTTEVAAAVQSLVGRVSAIYLPNDNTVISALETVLKTAKTHKLPVFSSDPESVNRGCLACIAPDQYAVGRQVGQIVIKLLKGQPIKNLPVEMANKNVLVLNLKVAQDLGIFITPDLIEKADYLIQPLSQSETPTLKPQP